MREDPTPVKIIALQIAAQLPEDRNVALKVVDCIRDIVVWRSETSEETQRRWTLRTNGGPSAEIYALPRVSGG